MVDNVIHFSSLGEAEKMLAELPGRMKQAAEQALYEAGEFMVTIAQGYCLVDTGTLQGSIRMEVVAEKGVSVKAGGAAYINPKTGRPCDYAVYVEHRNPFMRPAWETVRHLVEDLIRSKVAEQAL